MTLDQISLMDISDRETESAEQDQTARMCSLILLYTLRQKKRKVMVANCRVRAYTNSSFSEMKESQSVENAGVAFVKGTTEKNEFFEKINKQLCMTNTFGLTRPRTNNLRV